MKTSYPDGKSDLMTAFMIRSQDLTVPRGSWAMINLPSWMSLKSFEALRQELLKTQRIASMVHLGRGIFGSDFGTVAFVIDNVPANHVRGVYRRLFEQHVDVRPVSTIEALFLDPSYNRFDVHQDDIAVIPGSPIAYWPTVELARSGVTKPCSRPNSREPTDLALTKFGCVPLCVALVTSRGFVTGWVHGRLGAVDPRSTNFGGGYAHLWAGGDRGKSRAVHICVQPLPCLGSRKFSLRPSTYHAPSCASCARNSHCVRHSNKRKLSDLLVGNFQAVVV